MPGGGTGLNRSRYLLEPGYSIVKELFVAFAKITFAAEAILVKAKERFFAPLRMTNCTGPVLHAAATADVKIVAKQAFIGQILFSSGKGSFLTAGGEFVKRCF